MLSAPHPAFGHLPRFAEKGKPATASSPMKSIANSTCVNTVAHKGGGNRLRPIALPLARPRIDKARVGPARPGQRECESGSGVRIRWTWLAVVLDVIRKAANAVQKA